MKIRRIILAENKISDPRLPWGGLHVTIMGRDPSNEHLDFQKLVKKSVFDKKKKWTLSSSSGAKLEKWKGNWTIVIESSRTFSNFSYHLVEKGCQNVKGPDYSGTKWHITLPGYSKDEAKRYMESCIRHHKYYYLVESIEEDGEITYNLL